MKNHSIRVGHLLPLTKVRATLVILLFLLLVLSGCQSCGTRMPPGCEQFSRFFDLPSGERHSQLKMFPIEKQLDIYRCGMYREPPHSELADDIADGGKQNIPFLLERLKAETSELSQHDIIYIFEVMSYRDGALRGREDVTRSIREAVSAMKREQVKYKSQQMLRNIERNIAK